MRLADLYKNHLPILMLRTVKEWTRGYYTIVAVEASSPNNGHKSINVSSQKKWANRAIEEGITTLTYDELVDFISTAKYRTYSYIEMERDETRKDSEKVFFIRIRNSPQHKC